MSNKFLKVEVVGSKIAVVTLLGGDKDAVHDWGTRVCEHRICPGLIDELNAALDSALENTDISAVVVTGEGKFFCNGMDLQWIDKNMKMANQLQQDAESLIARILTFPLPTIAAINGHAVAAGSMLVLAFDYRIMNSERGMFFVPALDIGLVYSPGMTALLKCKTPFNYHNDMIVYSRRYTGKDLVRDKVVTEITAPESVLERALAMSNKLTANGRFGDAKYRQTMERIKKNTYKEAFELLSTEDDSQAMGFEDGTWVKGKGVSKL